MSKPRLLDLFCGAGGVARGFQQAGFYVVGIDIEDQPRYAGDEFWKGDAIRVLEILLSGGGLQEAIYNDRWAAVHASCPCQFASKTQRIQGNEHPDLIGRTRELLQELGLPYVIENVKGAPLENPQCLEGQMFGLNTHRPRYFETNWGYEAPLLRPPPPRQAKMGRRPKEGEAIQVIGNFTDVEAGRAAMETPWMTRDEMREAIPPAFTRHIGEALMSHLHAELPA